MLRLPSLVALVACLGPWAAACGDDGGGGRPTASTNEDAGPRDDRDAALPDFEDLPLPVAHDAGQAPPGEPPPELAGENCAIDTNKLFDLVSTDAPPEVAPLALDRSNLTFGMAFVDESETCVDAVYLAELHGGDAQGAPEVSVALDECAAIEQAALVHTGERWLFATVDSRTPPSDLWVQAEDDGDGVTPYRLTDGTIEETDVALGAFDAESVLIAWVERDISTNHSALKARVLEPDGEPREDEVIIDQGDGFFYTIPSLSRLGGAMGLVYNRITPEGGSEAVLELLDPATGERVRDPWVLTETAGAQPSVDLATDDEGGGVVYSSDGGGDARHLWFIQLDENGDPAPVMSGTMVGGPSDPRRIVNSPFRAVDASAVKLFRGFAVAYRALAAGAIDSPRLKVLFLDRVGRVIGDSEAALSTPYGGRTSIEISPDGRLTLGWSDTTEEGVTTIRMARVPCVGG